MDNTAPRFPSANIIAACIVAASLLGAALILAHRPDAALSNAVFTGPGVKTMAVPPITQEAAREQFRAQVVAAPKLHTFSLNHIDYTLSDVAVTQVLYSAKDDTFTVIYDLTWQPAMLKSGPQGGSASLNNDGYGHYFGVVSLASFGSFGDQDVDVTIK